MKKHYFIFLLILFSQVLAAQDKKDLTNDFYDNDTTYNLGVPTLEIAGEVANPGKVDLSKLLLRSEIVKEAFIDKLGDTVFQGAYRYDGYSLYDILNNITLKKKNEAQFKSIIDLYVEIENVTGEKVVLSWGEIYYPVNRHKIFIATKVARIVPSKTNELWPLPTGNKLVVATDLFTERNIYNPVKITVKSYACSIVAAKEMNIEMKDTYSKEMVIYKNGISVDTISKYPAQLGELDYSTVFYGRGRGIHGITTFTGVPITKLLGNFIDFNKANIQKSIIVIVGKDGYRGVFTYSEVFNRNDFAEVLLINRADDKADGAFSVFAAGDYFSDRAIKSISEIRILEKY